MDKNAGAKSVTWYVFRSRVACASVNSDIRHVPKLLGSYLESKEVKSRLYSTRWCMGNWGPSEIDATSDANTTLY